jgi:hypothetical protein
MSSINCSYPGCSGTVSGKGLFCPIHIPQPGEINKYSVETASELAYERVEDWAPRSAPASASRDTVASRRTGAIAVVGIIALLALLGAAGYWLFSRFF